MILETVYKNNIKTIERIVQYPNKFVYNNMPKAEALYILKSLGETPKDLMNGTEFECYLLL